MNAWVNPNPPLDLSGVRYGRLTAIRRGENIGKETAWICVCDCGNSKAVKTMNLRGGVTKSCGCYRSEHSRMAHRTHGMRNSVEYKTWEMMRARCERESTDSFPRYGGRGISVCDKWAGSFEAFFADMGPRPTQSHSIDRIDPNGNYTPENCRWATPTEQARNKTNSIFLTAFGERKPLLDWVTDSRCVVSEWALRQRINVGYGHEEAITTPKGTRTGIYREAKNSIYQTVRP